MSAMQQEAFSFNANHPLLIPDTTQPMDKHSFVELSMSAVRWHHAMTHLHRRIHHAFGRDSLHVAILLAINISFLLLVALRLKSLDDMLVASVAQLKHAESSLALMVHASTDPATVGQHVLAMLKLDAITEQWELTRIGMNVRVPFIHVLTCTVSPNFMISIFAALYVSFLRLVVKCLAPSIEAEAILF
ncbi:hypothetical protein WJX84_012347 [Apatococcus fuscideae]|uniref:Transmembrane protein n=1 Tax=Apatococcus fuscideae TaxID=2026836 RepID=A0AAW1SJ70_9CHLO